MITSENEAINSKKKFTTEDSLCTLWAKSALEDQRACLQKKSIMMKATRRVREQSVELRERQLDIIVGENIWEFQRKGSVSETDGNCI